MELTHEFTVPVAVETAWDHFQDIASVAECFPGAQVTGTEGATFDGSVKVKLGPIALVYNGTGTFTEKDETAHRFVVDARGKDKRGNGTAGATVTLTMNGTGESTDVKVHTDLAITGKPAQFGRGVMQDVSDKLLGQFVACLEQRLGEESSGAPHPAATASGEAAPAVQSAEPSAEAAEAVVPVSESVSSAPPAADLPPDEPAAAGVGPGAPMTPTPAGPTPPAPLGTSTVRGSDDALDLGKTVLPILVRSYWKLTVAAIVVIGVIIWLVAR